MNRRFLAFTVLPGLLLLFIAVASNAGVANAQSGPSISAKPTGAPDTYTVVGTGFAPNVVIRVVGVPCGELPCPAGGGGVVSPAPVIDAAGGFTAVLKLEPLGFRAGLPYWLIAAWPADRAALATDAQARVPASGVAATPSGAPATGSGAEAGESLPFGALFLAGLVLAAGSAFIVGLAAVRRR